MAKLPLRCIEVEINSHCNFRCAYCPVSIYPAKPKYMTRQSFAHILNELERIGFDGRLSFHFYNEPTLHPCLVEFVKMARTALPEVLLRIYSNGYKLNDSLYRKLINAGLDQLFITLHKKSPFQPPRPKQIVRELCEYQITNRGGALGEIAVPLDIPCTLPIEYLLFTLDGEALFCFEDFHRSQSMGNIYSEPIEEIYFNPILIEIRTQLANGNRYHNPLCANCNSDFYINENQVYIE